MTALEELKAKLEGNINVGLDKTGRVVVKTEKLISKEKPVRGKNGGVRPGSGRKTKRETIIRKGIKQWMDDHANDEVPIEITNSKTGERYVVKKSRRMIAIEKLFEIGTKGDKATGDAHAINMWLDRYMGKAAQPIRGDGEDASPIRLHVDNLEQLIDKVYGND